MTVRLTAVLLMGGLLLANMGQAADWPRFGGPKGDFMAPDTGINQDWANRPPRVLWQTAMSDDGYAGPAVAGGKVYIIDHRGAQDVVRAIDLTTGQDVWTFVYDDPGDPNYGFARSTPCIDEGLVYTLSRNGLLHALDAANGTRLWSRDLRADFQGQKPQWDYTASPIVDGDRLVVVAGGPEASVVTLNKKTGETIWAGGGTFETGYATPVIATINEVKQYIVFTAKALTGVSAADGALLWQIPWETSYGVNAALPIVDGNYVFATSGYRFGGGVFQISPDGPQQVWFSKAMQAHFSSPIYYKGFIWGTTDPGDLICLAPRDGTVLWRQGGFEKGGIVIVDDVIIALSGASGEIIMAAASTEGYQELGRLQGLGGQSWTAPIVADGKLIIRNKSALACLDLM
ncbi:MAG: PQQ-binding-like beta-propeller repeat protein [Armatimonadetes bacterium]|nr:PQQ-binding-like beta-propeller repeat protein [Armatimonadota bacterium]